METFSLFALTSLVVVVFSLLFIGTGETILSPIHLAESIPSRAFRLGCNFFSGSCIFLTLYRVLSGVSQNAQLGLFLTASICLILSFGPAIHSFSKRADFFSYLRRSSKNILLFAVILLFFFFLFLAQWLQVDTKQLSNPFASIGSLHSGRYAHIAEFIQTANQIPTLGQNYGQSLLASIPLLLGLDTPYLALSLWLFISIFFLMTLLLGVFQLLSVAPERKYWGLGIVLMGNTAFSLTPILVIDSGSPFALSGYFDSILSFSSFIVFIYMMRMLALTKSGNSHSKNPPVAPLKTKGILFLIFSLGITWCFSASQNIVLGSTLFVSLFFLFKALNLSNPLKSIIPMAVVFVFSIMLGTQLGGMLTPKSLRSQVDIKGVTSVEGNAEGLSTSLYTPHFYLASELLKQTGNPWMNSRAITPWPPIKLDDLISAFAHFFDYSTFTPIWAFETGVLLSIRALFFPIMALVFSLGYLKRNGLRLSQEGTMDSTAFYLYAGSVVFATGFLLEFVFEFNGYKWELARFLIPGIGILMTIFTVFADRFFRNVKNGNFLFSILALALCFPWTWYLITVLNDRAGFTLSRFGEMIHLKPI